MASIGHFQQEIVILWGIDRIGWGSRVHALGVLRNRIVQALQLCFRQAALLAALSLLAVSLSATTAFAQLGSRSTPSLSYYGGIEELYEGRYRDAEKQFSRETRNAIKIGVTGRWIDSICYHAMWGEVLYHQGRLGPALQQFDQACAMFLQNPQWMLRVKFKQNPRVDTSRARQRPPWGNSERQFTLGSLPTSMLIGQGDLQSGNRAAQQGGVVQAPQFWQVNVIEIVRCTALAIRRRNELLGPLAGHDSISREMHSALTRGGSPPNHWSGAWIQLQLGLAKVGRGQHDLALKHLVKAERIQGKFDHPLTCVALLEQGRIHMEKGNTAAAGRLLAEASYSAYYYEDYGVIDEAFRLGSVNRLVGGISGVNPALDLAARWARRERLDHIYARLSFAMSEDLMTLGNWDGAASTLGQGQSRLRDAKNGLLGSRSQFLTARLLYQQGRETAAEALAQALTQQAAMSPRNFQISMTNARFDQQQLRARSVGAVYQSLLSDPTAADWAYRPLDTMAVQRTPHGAAFDRWLAALMSSKDMGSALEVADLAKRRRYHGALAWGGRKAALRDTLESPAHTLPPYVLSHRNDLLLKFPEYDLERKSGQQILATIQAEWLDGIEESAQRDLDKQWRNWSASLGRREAMLNQIGLQRVASDPVFPPVSTTTELQSKLKPGQAVVVFHNTSSGLLGFLVTAKGSTHWNCGPAGRLAKPVNEFLRALGNYDANHDMTSKELTSTDWIGPGEDLFRALFKGSSIDLESTDELVVVPDGIVWYVPLAALTVKLEDRTAPLVSLTKLRVVPTMGLAFGNASPWRRVQRSGIVGKGIVPGDNDAEQDELLEPLRSTVTNLIEVPSPAPIPTPQVASLLESLIVLESIELNPTQPMAWSPMPAGRSSRQDSISYWLTLPQFGPQRVVLPGIRTVAERGGRTSKRRNRGSQVVPGHELFLASCGMMSTGAQTVLMSRWSVGGQSTLNIVREFVQELPHTSAAEARQRSVQVAMETAIRPDLEPRVKSSVDDPPMTAAHPFFWAGYLLIDAGEPAEVENEEPPS